MYAPINTHHFPTPFLASNMEAISLSSCNAISSGHDPAFPAEEMGWVKGVTMGCLSAQEG